MSHDGFSPQCSPRPVRPYGSDSSSVFGGSIRVGVDAATQEQELASLLKLAAELAQAAGMASITAHLLRAQLIGDVPAGPQDGIGNEKSSLRPPFATELRRALTDALRNVRGIEQVNGRILESLGER